MMIRLAALFTFIIVPLTAFRAGWTRAETDFELVAHGSSTMMLFDPARGTAVPSHTPVPGENTDSAVSPDGRWVAFTSDKTGTAQVWLRNVETGSERILTGGKCNSSSPAWELDSKAIVFASDCGRALGLPSLYRALVE